MVTWDGGFNEYFMISYDAKDSLVDILVVFSSGSNLDRTYPCASIKVKWEILVQQCLINFSLASG